MTLAWEPRTCPGSRLGAKGGSGKWQGHRVASGTGRAAARTHAEGATLQVTREELINGGGELRGSSSGKS